VKLDPVVYGKKQFELVCITCHQATVIRVRPPLALLTLCDVGPWLLVHLHRLLPARSWAFLFPVAPLRLSLRDFLVFGRLTGLVRSDLGW